MINRRKRFIFGVISTFILVLTSLSSFLSLSPSSVWLWRDLSCTSVGSGLLLAATTSTDRQLQCEGTGAHYFLDGEGRCRVLPGIEFNVLLLLSTTPATTTVKAPSPSSSLPVLTNKEDDDKPPVKFVPRPATFTTFLQTHVPDIDVLSKKFEEFSSSSQGAVGEVEGRRHLAAYLTFIYRSSWLLHTWADYTGILRAPFLTPSPISTSATTLNSSALSSSSENTNASSSSSSSSSSSLSSTGQRKLSAYYSGKEGMGLFTIKNFCVTLDGRLLAPPGDTDFQRRIDLFKSVDEHRFVSVTRMSNNAFLRQVAPFPTSKISSFSTPSPPGRRGDVMGNRSSSSSRSALGGPPFLPGKVLIMPVDGHSSKYNTGHMFHRSVSLNAIRKDINPVLLLVIPDLSIPPHLHNESTQYISRKYFGQGRCEKLFSDYGRKNGDVMSRANTRTCGLKGVALNAHHEMLGMPIAAISVANLARCRRKARGKALCQANLRNLNRKKIHAATMDMDDASYADDESPPSSPQSPTSPRRQNSPFETEELEDAFMCFDEGYFYHNHRKDLRHPIHEEHPLFKESIQFRGARETPPSSSTNQHRRTHIEFEDVSAHVAETTSVFSAREKQQQQQQQHPSSTSPTTTTTTTTSSSSQSQSNGGVSLIGNDDATTDSDSVDSIINISSSSQGVNVSTSSSSPHSPSLLKELVSSGVSPWRYAFGQRTSASPRKGKMLRDIRRREMQLAATKPPLMVELMVAGNVVTAPLQPPPIPSSPTTTTPTAALSYPPDDKADYLTVMFSVRSGPRRIPYFSAFAPHMSKAFPFLRFQFVEESQRAFLHNLHPRLAMQSDILVGVHGAMLTNVAYLPAPSNMSFSDGGGVLVELSSIAFTKTIEPQVSTFGTLASSLGIPMAKVKYLASTYHNNAEPANHSISTVVDTLALGVCMWCEHNYQNPHRRHSMASSGEEGTATTTNIRRTPAWGRNDLQSAGIFDLMCPQGAFGKNASGPYPLPPRQWERCCTCVFGGDDTYLQHGVPLLRYDVPIAPIIDASALRHLAHIETISYFRRTFQTTIVAYALLPGTTFVDGGIISSYLLDAIVLFGEQCQKSSNFRAIFVETLSNITTASSSLPHHGHHHTSSHERVFNVSDSALDPAMPYKLVNSKRLLKLYSKHDYVKSCGSALFIVGLLDSVVAGSSSSSSVWAMLLTSVVKHNHTAYTALLNRTITTTTRKHQPHVCHHRTVNGDDNDNDIIFNAKGLVHSIRSFANNYCRL